MGTTLSNGVYLPDEGERNCYAGLKVNWEILNQKVADISALQLAIAGALHRQIVASLPTEDIDPNTIYMILSGTSATENVYNEFMYVNNAWELIGTSATDLTNYYTKAEVDGKLLLKANASDLTSHTGDTTIHVTASDKTKWTNSANTHVLRLAKSALTPSSSTNAFSNLDDSTALKVGDKVMDTAGVLFEVTSIDTANSTFTIGTALIDLANDSDVVHNTGDENVNGIKTFKDMIPIDGDYLGNEASTNQRTNICLRSNRDTANKSCAYITRFRQNRSQGALQTGDLQKIGFDVLENGVRTNNVFDIQCTDWLNDVPQRVNLVSSVQSYSYGNSTNKALFNDLNPGALSFPDLNNGIDISGSITHLDKVVNSYTPTVNGYVYIRVRKTSLPIVSIRIQQNYGLMTSCETADFSTWGTYLPVVAGNIVEFYISADSLASAIFYPCQGNV